MRDALDRFLYHHWPRSFLLALVGLLVAAGLWWLTLDYAFRTYPQRVADSIIVPRGVELVGTEMFNSRKCKLSHIDQYYSTNQSWDKIILYYRGQLQRDWNQTGEGEYYRKASEHGRLRFVIHHIDMNPEGKPNDPALQHFAFKGATAYLVHVAYNQDLRVFNEGGVCEHKD